MGNTNIVLAANIQKYRKKSGLTQEELAEKLGVTFQAVSKWENAKSATISIAMIRRPVSGFLLFQTQRSRQSRIFSVAL